ncbi:MAG: hypothetical protein HZB26_15240 [Candidatus Hydrogenedentes bacterium]|nr:hypothetical protein [Candidatus Hydrogenedentota bacterium]
MKLMKRLCILGGALALFSILIVSALISRDLRWQTTVTPLTFEEIQRSFPVTSAASPEYERESNIPPSTYEADVPAAVIPPHSIGLVAAPTHEQIREAWSSEYARDFGSARARASRTLLSAVATAFGGSYCGQMRGEIGEGYLRAGDFDAARNYLRAAIRIERDYFGKSYDYVKLAWLEEDPQVATALLERSCAKSSPGAEIDIRAPQNALRLAIVTGSDELATYYYQRYRDSWDQWHDQLDSDIRVWIAARRAKK